MTNKWWPWPLLKDERLPQRSWTREGYPSPSDTWAYWARMACLLARSSSDSFVSFTVARVWRSMISDSTSPASACTDLHLSQLLVRLKFERLWNPTHCNVYVPAHTHTHIHAHTHTHTHTHTHRCSFSNYSLSLSLVHTTDSDIPTTQASPHPHICS